MEGVVQESTLGAPSERRHLAQGQFIAKAWQSDYPSTLLILQKHGLEFIAFRNRSVTVG